jgi:cytochrome c oxidase subunit I
MTASGYSEEVQEGPPNYITAKKGLLSWVISTDHKRIGVMYLIGIMFFFFFAAALALTFRLELLFPEMQFLSNLMYNRLLTLHGVVMIFLFVIPGIPAVFGNFFLPIMIGAKDVSFPKINLLSWYCYMVGAVLAVGSVVLGGIDTGWTLYVPYLYKTDHNVLIPLLAAFILGWSSILTGLNFIVTTHRLRDPRMGWYDMPLFVWSLYATAWVQVIATPVVGITLLLVLMERFLGVAIFNPAQGGDPLLYEHMFWIYSHPAVYVMILPAMGVVSEIIPCFSRKHIFGYKFIAWSSIAIAGIGSLVWAHHMFTSGMSDEARIFFSFLTYFVAVPSAVKVFNWLSTMYQGSIKLDPPMIWALLFIFLFCIGGLTGMVNAALSADIHLHDTAWVVAHFHYTMFGGTAVIFFAALHYWWPKMFGRMYSVKSATRAAILFFVGFNCTYIPLFIIGVLGMPRRYADYLPEYHHGHALSTVGSWLMVGALVWMAANLIRSLVKGEVTNEENTWGGATLEWRVATPPPTLNFTDTPDMSRGPYEYPEEVEES